MPKTAKPKPVGEITHFFPNISVAVVKVLSPLKVGDKVKIEGHGSSFEQTIDSMQIEHDKIQTAKKGQEIGMKVNNPVKEKDLLFKI